jgi:hypothetical protein
MKRHNNTRINSDNPTSTAILLSVAKASFTIVFALTLLGVNSPLYAQLITCANTVTPVNANAFTATLVDDVVVNCDMLQVDNDGHTLKAIAYGRRFFPVLSGTGSASSHVYCEDWNGNSLTIPLPTNVGGNPFADASRPDVVLADDFADQGGGSSGWTGDYKVAVVYQINTDVYLDVYKLSNLGTGSFSYTTIVSQHQVNTIRHPADTFHTGPHIDMWSDANNLNSNNGLPSMHEFAIVWAEDPCVFPFTCLGHSGNIEASEVMYMAGDINDVSYATNWLPVHLEFDHWFPDVACLTDINTGEKKMQIVYNQWAPYPYDLDYVEFNYSTPAPITSTPIDNGEFFSPRIEAMSQYDNTAGTIKWQAAASKGLFSINPMGGGPYGWRVYQYNDFNGYGGSHLSSPHYWYDCKSPCVAAGISTTFSSDLGNTQYTTSYNPHVLHNFYNRIISPFTGVEDSRWWEVVDSNVNPVVYNWDASRSTAISNCSNSGLNLLTAWFDGTNIVYKESPNTNAYKSTGVTSALQSKARIYPNPVKTNLQISNADNMDYQLVDVTGRTVKSGIVKHDAILDMGSLQQGFYMIQLSKDGTIQQTLKLTKE